MDDGSGRRKILSHLEELSPKEEKEEKKTENGSGQKKRTDGRGPTEGSGLAVPVVQWLEHNPFTVGTRIRFPSGIEKKVNERCIKNNPFIW
jgi:hypothetical protein